jgi:hypothetical protein
VAPTQSSLQAFNAMSWFFGTGPLSPASILQPLVIVGSLAIALAIIIGGIAAIKLHSEPDAG